MTVVDILFGNKAELQTTSRLIAAIFLQQQSRYHLRFERVNENTETEQNGPKWMKSNEVEFRSRREILFLLFGIAEDSFE